MALDLRHGFEKVLDTGFRIRFSQQPAHTMRGAPVALSMENENVCPDTTSASRDRTCISDDDVITLSPAIGAREAPAVEPILSDGSTLNVLAGIALSPSDQPKMMTKLCNDPSSSFHISAPRQPGHPHHLEEAPRQVKSGFVLISRPVLCVMSSQLFAAPSLSGH